MKIQSFVAIAAFMLILTGWKIAEKNLTDSYRLQSGSVIAWKGSMPNGANNGTFEIGNHSISTEGRRLIGGEFTFPIASIKNLNIPDAAPREQLVHHLLSKDFFDVVNHPNATFKITRAEPVAVTDKNAVAGTNYRITGELTMLGRANEVVFPANIAFAGKQMIIAAAFKIDRTRWGMNYAADPAGPQVIDKDVEISFQLRANRG